MQSSCSILYMTGMALPIWMVRFQKAICNLLAWVTNYLDFRRLCHSCSLHRRCFVEHLLCCNMNKYVSICCFGRSQAVLVPLQQRLQELKVCCSFDHCALPFTSFLEASLLQSCLGLSGAVLVKVELLGRPIDTRLTAASRHYCQLKVCSFQR